jgi:hypothetical protein
VIDLITFQKYFPQSAILIPPMRDFWAENKECKNHSRRCLIAFTIAWLTEVT